MFNFISKHTLRCPACCLAPLAHYCHPVWGPMKLWASQLSFFFRITAVLWSSQVSDYYILALPMLLWYLSLFFQMGLWEFCFGLLLLEKLSIIYNLKIFTVYLQWITYEVRSLPRLTRPRSHNLHLSGDSEMWLLLSFFFFFFLIEHWLPFNNKFYRGLIAILPSSPARMVPENRSWNPLLAK